MEILWGILAIVFVVLVIVFAIFFSRKCMRIKSRKPAEICILINNGLIDNDLNTFAAILTSDTTDSRLGEVVKKEIGLSGLGCLMSVILLPLGFISVSWKSNDPVAQNRRVFSMCENTLYISGFIPNTHAFAGCVGYEMAQLSEVQIVKLNKRFYLGTIKLTDGNVISFELLDDDVVLLEKIKALASEAHAGVLPETEADAVFQSLTEPEEVLGQSMFEE